MKRGEIWTLAGGQDYAGKLRPVVILQDIGSMQLPRSLCAPSQRMRRMRRSFVSLSSRVKRTDYGHPLA
jgi:mRNA-degrading endonuclease toxin of MazEF toxin-antitoxin module